MQPLLADSSDVGKTNHSRAAVLLLQVQGGSFDHRSFRVDQKYPDRGTKEHNTCRHKEWSYPETLVSRPCIWTVDIN
jgi:hypothetical protein